LLAISFLFLIGFGARLIIGPGRTRLKWITAALVVFLWGLGIFFIFNNGNTDRSQLIAADVFTRYSLAIPGAALTCWGLILQGRKLYRAGMPRFGLDAIIAGIAFALYGGIGQLFVAPSIIFPSSYINSDVFLRWLGFPIQGFRALMAVIAAIFVIRSLRAFDEENRRRIQALSEAQMAEQARLQALRAELLHRTVQAQEQERQRIARELHDETGQTLTALGLGLNAMSQTITTNPQRATKIADQLQHIATDGLMDLQNLVNGLHPPQLDELGLLPALRWYTQEIGKRFHMDIEVNAPANQIEIHNHEVRLTIFRIAQEAITNSVRHAQADRVIVNLETLGPENQLTIEDNGQGFNVDAVLAGNERNCLGLLGMIERAALIGGDCEIQSVRGRGTIVQVKFNDVKESESPNPSAAG